MCPGGPFPLLEKPSLLRFLQPQLFYCQPSKQNRRQRSAALPPVLFVGCCVCNSLSVKKDKVCCNKQQTLSFLHLEHTQDTGGKHGDDAEDPQIGSGEFQLVLQGYPGHPDQQPGCGVVGSDHDAEVLPDQHAHGDVVSGHTELFSHPDAQGHEAEEEGVGAQHHAERHGQAAHDGGQFGPQGVGHDVDQDVGHALHHPGAVQNPQEDTGGQQDHGSQQGSGGVAFHRIGLFLGRPEVDDQSGSQTDHEGAVQRNLGEAHEQDDHQGDQPVDPHQFGPFQAGISRSIVPGHAHVFRQFSGFPGGVQAGAPFLFQEPHVDTETQDDQDPHTLEGQQFMPQDAGVGFQDNGGTGHRAAPGRQVHDTDGGGNDAAQHHGTDVEFFVQRQHGRDGDQAGPGGGAVQVGDGGDDPGGNGHQDDVVPGFLCQEVHQRIEHAHIIHQSKINNGEQEQDGGGHGGAHAFFDEGEDFRRSKTAEQGNNNGECHENGDGIHFGGDQTVDHQSDQDKTSNT